MTQESPNYYAVLTADVRYDKSLLPGTKLLFAEITALCNQKGYCWARNSYFAKLYGVTPRTITRWLNALSDRGYVTIKMRRDPKNQVTERHIYVPRARVTIVSA